jgi:hypothetical protein
VNGLVLFVSGFAGDTGGFQRIRRGDHFITMSHSGVMPCHILLVVRRFSGSTPDEQTKRQKR